MPELPEVDLYCRYLARHALRQRIASVRVLDERIVARRRGAVKSLLLSQDIIAGMGNLYVDETLYRASIHPRRAVDKLSDAEVKSIFTCMRAILKEAIAFKSRGGDYPGRWLVPHREEGDTCPICRGTIQRTGVFGRTTYFCGTHQR